MSHILTNAVWDLDIPDPIEKLVLLSLASHSSNEGNCFPSMKRLCSRTGLSERSVRRRLRSLELHGWLIIEYKSGHSSNYTLKIPTHTPVTQTGPPGPIDPTTPVSLTPIISNLNTVIESVKEGGNKITPAEIILLEGSLKRINARIEELKDSDYPNLVQERKSLKASRKVLLSKLGIPA